jgi:hypothetical protein
VRAGVAVAFHTYIREVLGSDFGRDTRFQKEALCGFPQSLNEITETVPRLGHDSFHPNSNHNLE